MLAEIVKMENLNHPNVMPLIGVCIDEEHGMSIVMPFMANGSLLMYLKRERDCLCLGKRVKEDAVSLVQLKILQYLSAARVSHDYVFCCP